MPPIVLYGDRVSVKITREFKQLVNISIAAGKFILLHPDYDLIREAMRLEMFEDERLEDFEVHNWQFEVDEVITYDQGEILFFYALLELSCRIFLCEIGDDLKKMAIDSGETDAEEFVRVRSFFLRQAQDFLQNIRGCYESDEEFQELLAKIDQLNSLA
ncbi:MAG TPA: hypothetical protein PLI47_10130 [Bacteroidia bacterium]|nr:hypothetical protein [Bacteroidota bacterium]MBL0257738.1 hypothetical protein [Bacteroidota bacterium]MBP6403791.1 hypothetical protein [Bacteroidia bacterium]MBP6649909.1 hypothetical protein [Bacteroidia bacterium]HQW23652.1 hypothetical protein [Bacteroidia bacterium]